MNGRSRASRALVLAGLCALAASMSLWLSGSGGFRPDTGQWLSVAVGIVPPLVLAGLLAKRVKRWGELIALFMVPYVCIGTMDVVAGAGALWSPLVVAGSALVTFFAALDAARRDG